MRAKNYKSTLPYNMSQANMISEEEVESVIKLLVLMAYAIPRSKGQPKRTSEQSPKTTTTALSATKFQINVYS